MKFKSYINQAWNDHAKNAQKVSDEFPLGLSLVASNDELSQFAGLVTHVMGEHLGRWDQGKEILLSLKNHKNFISGSETERAVQRSLAVMELGKDGNFSIGSFGLPDQIRILAVTASAQSEQKTQVAQALLLKALDLARQGLDSKDAANRALAITGNNLACALEGKKDRSQLETELMILSAKTAREFWGVAGGWLEIERAEYRLAMSYLQAREFAKGLEHAQICLEICSENKAESLEHFFGYEALAKIEKSRGNYVGFEKALELATVHFEKLSSEHKTWCESSLKGLKS